MASKVEEALSGAMSAVFAYHPEAPNEDTVRDALDALIAAVREEERERDITQASIRQVMLAMDETSQWADTDYRKVETAKALIRAARQCD